MTSPFQQLLDIDRRAQVLASTAAEGEATADVFGTLAMRLGAEYLLLPLDQVSELIKVPRMTPVPGVRSWLRGITNLRGSVISIIDLRDFISGRPMALTARTRVAVVRAGEWGYGLLVDEVIGMRHFNEQDCIPLADDIASGLRPYVAEAFQGEGRRWLLFEADRLVADPRFLNAAS